jgi:hypothetical protein
MRPETTAEEETNSALEAAASATTIQHTQAGHLLPQSRSRMGFTLAELLVTMGVLVLLVLLFSQLLNSAATITTLGHKQMDMDSQARELLDRMSVDVMHMVKRLDVDYLLKAPGNATDCTACGTTSQAGNDQIAFYSNVPGYFPSTAPNSDQRSSVSIVGYRVHTSIDTLSNRLERLGAGLVWNGATNDMPLVFWTALNPWLLANNNNVDIVGPQVFRFEYCYLLRNGTLSATPWYTASSVRGMQDVAAIVADIAVIDPKSRGLFTSAQITTLAGTLANYTTQAPGVLLSSWRNTIDTDTSLPRPALSGVRLYERYLYLSPPTL